MATNFDACNCGDWRRGLIWGRLLGPGYAGMKWQVSSAVTTRIRTELKSVMIMVRCCRCCRVLFGVLLSGLLNSVTIAPGQTHARECVRVHS
jgi:hypothetical protein